MTEEQKVLSGKVGSISVRRVNHGFVDTLVVTRPDGSRFAFQNIPHSLGDRDEIGSIRMAVSDDLVPGEETISCPLFEVERQVKRVFFSDGGVQHPVGFVISSKHCLPVILAPGNILGSLSILGLETRGRENGLEFSPIYYLLK